MDVLADILKQAGLHGRLLNQRSFVRPTHLKFPCNKSIGFHVVTHGEMFLHAGGTKSPIHLERGDVALMARGHDHIVSTHAEFRSQHVRSLGDDMGGKSKIEKQATDKDLDPLRLSLVSGAYQLWHDPVHPFLNELPDWFVIRANEIESYDPLHSAIGLLSQEVAKHEVGSERVVEGLLDLIFTFILRRVIQKTSAKPQTWSHALQDSRIHKAIELMHGDCARNWTIEELAQNVGLSRAGFAQKFKAAMGETPLHYLTGVRIQKAMNLLTNSNEKVESVANAVGYQDAFGFSKVFKKVTGLPPKTFRARDLEQKTRPYRFG